MLATLCGAALTVVASLALGCAILKTFAPRLPRAIAGGVGYAALICIAAVLVRAPGRAGTGLVVIALVSLAGAWRARDGRPRATSAVGAILAAGAVLVLLSLPFLAAGHVGPLGVGLDDDLGFHLGWVYHLAHGPPPFPFFSLSYPLGSESLAACLTALGIGDEQALIGVTAAALALISVTAFAALSAHDWKLRVPIAIACGVPFLSAGYFGEASFKEPIMGLLVLTLVLGVTGRARPSWGDAAVLLVLSTAAELIFGPPGLVWPVAFVATGVFAERWRRPRSRKTVARQLLFAAGALGAVVLLAVLASAVGRQIGASGFRIFLGGPPAGVVGGNFVRQLPLSEGLGVWFGHDFRLPYSSGVLPTLAVVFAIAAFASAAVGLLREWRTTLLLPTAAAIVIYLAARETTVAYFSAKLLVGVGPLLVLFVCTGLLSLRRVDSNRARSAIPLVLALVFAASVIWSSAGTLRRSPVDDRAFGAELASYRPLVAHHTVVFLGSDGWVSEWLRGATISYYPYPSHFSVRPLKDQVPPFDFDTPNQAALNSADYVITTRTLDASSPPANWKLVRVTAHYELFRRRGTAPAREILAEEGAPGATLDCSQPSGRALAARLGIAAVRTAPVSSPGWRDGGGARLASATGPATATFMYPGELAFSTLPAMRGPVELSLAYSTSYVITLSANGVSVRLTPTLEPYGPLWRATDVATHGHPLSLRVQIGTGHEPIGNYGAMVGPVYAVPTGRQDTIVPLKSACGRYVDWYRLAG